MSYLHVKDICFCRTQKRFILKVSNYTTLNPQSLLTKEMLPDKGKLAGAHVDGYYSHDTLTTITPGLRPYTHLFYRLSYLPLCHFWFNAAAVAYAVSLAIVSSN